LKLTSADESEYELVLRRPPAMTTPSGVNTMPKALTAEWSGSECSHELNVKYVG